MQLTSSQNKIIVKIINYYLLCSSSKNNVINFKAPTGSGKTFMAANIISEIIGIEKEKNQKVIFVIATISSSELPKQMEDNLNQYNLFVDNKFIVKREESPSTNKNKVKDYTPEIKLDNNKVIILGKSSFGKTRIFTEQGVFKNFIHDVKNNGYKLIYIRDEAHWGMDKKQNLKIDELKFEELISKNAYFTIKMTATPNGNEKLVELNERDLLNDDNLLLKQKVNLNSGIKSQMDELEFLNVACEKFKEIKNAYHNEPILNNENINPAMLIQVDNNTNSDFEIKIKSIINVLEKQGLTWLKYFGASDIEKSSNIREDTSLKQVSKNSSSIDVIIFKIGPSTGWNIPRATMLVQLRSISSSNLNIQTIGRIKRNPIAYIKKSELLNNGIDWENIISNKYFLYSNYQEKSREMWQYQIKDKFKDVALLNFVIEYKTFKNHMLFKNYINNIYEILQNKTNIDLVLEKIQSLKFEIDKYGYIIHESENLQDNISKINANIIKEKINNNLELQIFNNKFINLNNQILTKEVLEEIWKFIEDTFTNKRYKSNPLKNPQLVLYVIFKILFTKIKEEYHNKIKEVKKDFAYKSEPTLLPKEYNIWHPNTYTNDLSLSEDNLFNKYGYFRISEEAKNQKIITFDSNNEYDFISKIYGYLFDFYEKELENLEIWLKNPVMNGIYVEYAPEDSLEIKKSYPDLILKSKFKTIYIEIKSIDDINENKTKNLIEGYKKYIHLFEDKNTYLAIVNNSQTDNKNMNIFIFGFKEHNELLIEKKLSTIKKLLDFLFHKEN